MSVSGQEPDGVVTSKEKLVAPGIIGPVTSQTKPVAHVFEAVI